MQPSFVTALVFVVCAGMCAVGCVRSSRPVGHARVTSASAPVRVRERPAPARPTPTARPAPPPSEPEMLDVDDLSFWQPTE